MTAIRSGTLTALFLYDVAEAARLGDIGSAVASACTGAAGATAGHAGLHPVRPAAADHRRRSARPHRRRGQRRPLQGVRLRRDLRGDLAGRCPRPGRSSCSTASLARRARPLAGEADVSAASSSPAFAGCDGAAHDFITEDYLVFSITALDDHVVVGRPSSRPWSRHRPAAPRRARAAQPPGARGGAAPPHLVSRNDLVIPTWSAAFVYDNERGAQAVLEILEFANSQLLEFRYYDGLLDARAGADLRPAAGAGLVQRVEPALRAAARECTRSSSTSTS